MKNLREFAIETYQNKIAFLPGEVVRGELYVCFEEPIEMKSIKVFLYGEGQGAWLEQSRQTTKEKNINTNETKTKEILIDIGLLLFGYTDDKNTNKHEKGRFLYSFEFNLPKNIPCTFKSPPEKDLGYARYCLKTVISRPRKYDKITKLSITINELIESDRPDLMFTPGSFNEKSVSTACLPSGTLGLEGYLNQSYYCQGDDILITAIGENGSPKILKEMYAKLIRRVRYKARYGTNTYTTDRAHINGSRIPAQSKLAWRDEPLKVPAVGPTISGNYDIRVDYIVRLGMFEELGSEIHLDLPVIIGTIGTKEGEGKEEEQVEADVFDRNKNRYGLQVIKAADRNKHREVLKEKVEAVNNPLTADTSDEGLNTEFDLEEINIALDEEVEAGFDDEAFLKGLEDEENRSKSVGSKPLFDKEKRSHPTRSKSVESIKSSLRGSKNSLSGGELSKREIYFNGSTGSIGGRKSSMSASSIGGSTNSMYGSKDDLKRSTSGTINGLGSSTSSLGSAKHEGRRVSLGKSPRGLSASAGSLRKPLNESDRLKYDTAKGMSASVGSLDKGAAKDSFGIVDSLDHGKGNVTSSKDSLDGGGISNNEGSREYIGGIVDSLGSGGSNARKRGKQSLGVGPGNVGISGSVGSLDSQKSKDPLRKNKEEIGGNLGSLDTGNDIKVDGNGFLVGQNGAMGGSAGSLEIGKGGKGSLAGKKGVKGSSLGSLETRQKIGINDSAEGLEKKLGSPKNKTKDPSGNTKSAKLESNTIKKKRDEFTADEKKDRLDKKNVTNKEKVSTPKSVGSKKVNEINKKDTKQPLSGNVINSKPQKDKFETDELLANLDNSEAQGILTKSTDSIHSDIETPIIPLEQIADVYSAIDEEQFLKEFEKLEKQFESESPAKENKEMGKEKKLSEETNKASHYIPPTMNTGNDLDYESHCPMSPIREENEESDETKKNEKKKPQDLNTSESQDKKVQSRENDSTFCKLHSSSDPRKASKEEFETNNAQRNSYGQKLTEITKKEGVENEERGATAPWDIVGVIGRWFSKIKKDKKDDESQSIDVLKTEKSDLTHDHQAPVTEGYDDKEETKSSSDAGKYPSKNQESGSFDAKISDANLDAIVADMVVDVVAESENDLSRLQLNTNTDGQYIPYGQYDTYGQYNPDEHYNPDQQYNLDGQHNPDGQYDPYGQYNPYGQDNPDQISLSDNKNLQQLEPTTRQKLEKCPDEGTSKTKYRQKHKVDESISTECEPVFESAQDRKDKKVEQVKKSDGKQKAGKTKEGENKEPVKKNKVLKSEGDKYSPGWSAKPLNKNLGPQKIKNKTPNNDLKKDQTKGNVKRTIHENIPIAKNSKSVDSKKENKDHNTEAKQVRKLSVSPVDSLYSHHSSSENEKDVESHANQLFGQEQKLRQPTHPNSAAQKQKLLNENLLKTGKKPVKDNMNKSNLPVKKQHTEHDKRHGNKKYPDTGYNVPQPNRPSPEDLPTPIPQEDARYALVRSQSGSIDHKYKGRAKISDLSSSYPELQQNKLSKTKNLSESMPDQINRNITSSPKRKQHDGAYHKPKASLKNNDLSASYPDRLPQSSDLHGAVSKKDSRSIPSSPKRKSHDKHKMSDLCASYPGPQQVGGLHETMTNQVRNLHWSVPNEINRSMAGSPKRKSPGFTTGEKAKRMRSDENPLQGNERLASSYPLTANEISQRGYPKTLKKEKPKPGTKEDDQKKLQTETCSDQKKLQTETCSDSQTASSQFKDNEIDVDEGYRTIERSKKDPKTERSRAVCSGDRPGNDQSRPPICIRPSSSSPAKIPLKKKSVGDKKNPIEERSRFGRIGDRQENDQSRSPICERKDKPPSSDPLQRRGLPNKNTANKNGVLKTSKPNSYVSIYKQKKETYSSPDISQNFTSKAKHTVSHNDSHDTTDVLPPNTDKTESDIILKKKTTPMKDVQKEILTSSAKNANNDDEYADNTSQQRHSDKDDGQLLEGYDMKPVSNSNRSTSKSRDHLPSSKDNSEDKLKKEKEEDTQQTSVPVNDTKHKATKGILKRKEAKQTYPGFHYHPIGNELQSPIPYKYKTNKLQKEPLPENSDGDFHSKHSSRTQSPITSPLKLPNSPTKPPYSSVTSPRKFPVCSPMKRPQSSVASSSNIPTAEVRGPILPYFGHIEQLDRKLKDEENRREVDTYDDEGPLAEVPEDFILPEAPRRNSSGGQTFPVKSQEFEFVLRPPYAVECVTLEGPPDKVMVEYRVEVLERDSTNDKDGQENKDDESKQIRDSKQKQNAKDSPLTLPDIPTHPSLSIDTSKNMTLPKPPQKEENKKLNDKKQNESFNILWNYSTILRTPPMLKRHINKNEETEGFKDAWERKRNKSRCSTNDETVNQPIVKRSQSLSPNQMRRNKKLKPTATDENTIPKTRSRSKSPREDQTTICEKDPQHVSNKVNPSNSTIKKAFADESRAFAGESQALENQRLNKSSDKGKLKDGAKKLKTSSEGKHVNEETLNNLIKTRNSPRSGKTNLDHERSNKSSGALKGPKGDKKLKEGGKDVSKQAKKQPSHDDRIVIGGGLMFHSPQKKTLQSSKKTIQSSKKTQQTSQQKIQSPKKEPKKISRLAQNQAVKNKNKVEHSKLQKDVFDPISQSIGDKIEYKYISENDLKRDESTMENKQRMEEEAWERKIKEYLNKNKGEGNFYTIPSTSCGYSVVPHRVRDDESHLIPSALVVPKMVCEENVAVRKKVQPSPSKKAPTSRVQVQANKGKKSNTKPTSDTRPNEKEMDIIKSSRDKTTNDDPLKDTEEQHLNQYEPAENRKIKGVTHGAEQKEKENNITVTKRPKSDRRYHKKQDDSDEEEYFDQLLVTKKPPRSAVRPLSSKSSHNRSLPETTYAELDLPVLPVKHPNWYVEEHPEEEDLPAVAHTIQAKTDGPNLFDSFEGHEKTLGIIDANGQLRSNQELLHGNFENIEEISEEEEQRKIRIQRRKNKRFISDLQMIKHSRPSSCPPAIGAREGLLEFFDHEYDDINGSETGTEYTTDGEEHIRRFSSADDEEYPSDFESEPATGEPATSETTDRSRNDKSNKEEIENSKPAIVTIYASKRAPYKAQNSTNVEHGCFGYEEEVIETYQYIEERPHKPTIDLSKSSYEPGSANARKTHVEKQKKSSLEKTNSGVNNKRTIADVTPVKRAMRIGVHNKPTVHRQNPDVEYLYEYAFE